MVKTSIPLYDISVNQYNEQGEIGQLIYASQCVSKYSNACIAFADERRKFVLFIASHTEVSKLANLCRHDRRIHMLQKSSGRCVTALLVGYKPDCTYVLNYLLYIIQNHLLVYGEGPSVAKIAHELSSWVSRGLGTLTPSASSERDDDIVRPLAASVVLGSLEADQLLTTVEVGGAVVQGKLLLLGDLDASRAGRLQRIVDEHFQDPVETSTAQHVSRLCLQMLAVLEENYAAFELCLLLPAQRNDSDSRDTEAIDIGICSAKELIKRLVGRFKGRAL
jgi:20S proteasome alpha/beta subunit